MTKEIKVNFSGLTGTILFLTFLFGKIFCWQPICNWSWWWVFSPIWIPIALFLVFLLIMFIFKMIFS